MNGLRTNDTVQRRRVTQGIEQPHVRVICSIKETVREPPEGPAQHELAGAQVAAGITSHAIARWDAIIDESVIYGQNSISGETRVDLGFRLPRSTTTQLVWATTATAVAQYRCLITVGLFPVSLGQDGVV